MESKILYQYRCRVCRKVMTTLKEETARREVCCACRKAMEQVAGQISLI